MSESPRDILERLRRIMPVRTLVIMKRPLHWREAKVVAERQAAMLLKLLGVTKPSVEIELVLEHAPIEVISEPSLDVSASSDWAGDHWQITMNASESLWRARASLAHEVKHILDDPYREVLYPNWDRFDPSTRPDDAEQICDYFAGCVLVPAKWLRRAWSSGLRDIADLSSLFDVSEALMKVRLRQVGLVLREGRRLLPYARRSPQYAGASA